jgi:hypothetical protein
MVESQGTIKTRWSKLDSDRSTQLNRARLCAALTIPSLLPPDGSDQNTELATPAQAHGARCVNNLSSKLWLTLFPPNAVFFKLDMSKKALRQLEAMDPNQQENLKSSIDASFADIENTCVQYMDTNGMRSPAFRALRNLVVTGETLVYIPPSGHDSHPWNNPGAGMKVFRRDQFVVLRDPMGNVLEIVTKEPVSVEALPDTIAAKAEKGGEKKPEKKLDLYTRIWLKDGVYKVGQEVEGESIPQADGFYPPNANPWLPLRWSDDGRGPVEEYLGDFMTLETESQAMAEGANAMAKCVILNNPNGVTRKMDLINAKNLDVISGKVEDVGVVQLEKHADFRVVAEHIDKIEQRLAFAFLLNSSIQRSAERVTAEEIRFMAQELEDALGGQYSVLSQEFQLPLVKLILANLEASGEIPPLPKEDVKPVITAGLEALGRTHEQQRMAAWLQDCGAVLTPEVVAQRVSPGEYMKRAATNYGVDPKGLLKTDEQVAQEQQQQIMQKMAMDSVPGVAGQMAGMVKDNPQMLQGAMPKGGSAQAPPPQ